VTLDIAEVLAEKPPKRREIATGLPDERWHWGVLRLQRARGGLSTPLSYTGGLERPESEVHAEFRDLVIERFAPSVALCLSIHVLGGIPLERAAFRAHIGRRTALRELGRLREMYGG